MAPRSIYDEAEQHECEHVAVEQDGHGVGDCREAGCSTSRTGCLDRFRSLACTHSGCTNGDTDFEQDASTRKVCSVHSECCAAHQGRSYLHIAEICCLSETDWHVVVQVRSLGGMQPTVITASSEEAKRMLSELPAC